MPILGTVASFGLSPEAPTIGVATAGDTSATVTYTAPTWSGKTSGSVTYTATSSPGSYTGTGSSPITVSGLSNGTSYTFTVTATTSYGVTGPSSAASNSITPAVQGQPDRAVFMGGVSSTYFASNAISNIDYLSISTTGNATNFGNLITARIGLGGFSSSTRSIIGGGTNTSNSSVSSIEYITIASPGNATSFGNLTNPKGFLTGALSNDIYGMWYGGVINNSFPETAQMEYVTIATTGNGTLFGNLATTVFGGAVGAGNTTRGIIATGPRNSGNNYTEIIQYFTWATSGNTTSFGNASLQLSSASGTSSSTRMIFGGGYGVNGVQRSQIDYITIATTGNSTSFGSLTVGRSFSGSTGNKTRGIFAGGADSGDWSTKSSIDYVTIETTGNATNFGNLTVARSYIEGTSGSHGGIA